ncbi:MAG: hypothetical protein ACR2OG_16960 [Gemmatimonadaceae bacterium]
MSRARRHTAVFRLLPATESSGMELTSAFQIVPEQSTVALIVHHPKATRHAIRGEAAARSRGSKGAASGTRT